MENGFYGFPKNRTYTKPIPSASYAESASYSLTSSYTPNALATASVNLNTITFTKGDGSTFPITVDTGSGTGGSTFPYTGSAIISGSLTITGSLTTDDGVNVQTITASIISASSGMTGSLFGTASWAVSASQTISASYTLSSSYALSSSYTLTASYSLSSSFATTASWAANGGVTQLLAGSNISLSPSNGLGQVTISSTGGGSSFNTATGSYGSFYDTTIQTNPVGNVPRSMSLNTTAITNGVSISGSTNPFNTYIKTENAGIYNIQFSAQVEKTDSGTDEIVIWLRKNGIDLTDTATTISLVGNNAKNVAAWNWFVPSAANDYYQIIWYSPDTAVRLLAEVAGGGHPGIPSVIVTVNRVDQFLSNTGSFTGSFTGAFTGSLFGTASWAQSASQAITASYILQAVSASFATNALTASFLPVGTYAITASWAQSASQAVTASYVLQAVSASFLISSSFSTNIGDGVNTSYIVTHNLNTRNTHITVYSASGTFETVYPDIQRPTVNTATIIFANPPTTNQYTVYISL